MRTSLNHPQPVMRGSRAVLLGLVCLVLDCAAQSNPAAGKQLAVAAGRTEMIIPEFKLGGSSISRNAAVHLSTLDLSKTEQHQAAFGYLLHPGIGAGQLIEDRNSMALNQSSVAVDAKQQALVAHFDGFWKPPPAPESGFQRAVHKIFYIDPNCPVVFQDGMQLWQRGTTPLSPWSTPRIPTP